MSVTGANVSEVIEAKIVCTITEQQLKQSGTNLNKATTEPLKAHTKELD